ncbi:TcpE family conjugal transfer membrane protein [Enterococcus avium]|uniref:TcpE family conjugal transfer membrane protein n=1 Tax=Enterococcus avium TaxID=33945 RepID=UPI00288EB0B0|nr:TcpE family conjugal transfer membrane protein [Enterococcus avium]MDT2467685.1 TcpE family conjugal transfer membrane protein [Enterococcus avium]MDT2507090.1 TcpE family conjugal transfer membrane protein [Enterococcus avium]
MKWEPYNYSAAFKEPYRIQDLGNLGRLPAPIAVVNIGSFILVLALMLGFFRNFIQSVAETLPFFPALCYIGFPVASVLLLNKVQPDGKKIHYYVFDFILYTVSIQWRDVVFFNGNAYNRLEVDNEISFMRLRQ